MSVSPRRLAAEKAEEVIREQLQSEESETESHFALNEAQTTENTENNEPLKPSASSGSLQSQRSVPKRRAAYKAAARIRRIAKQEAEEDAVSETETESESDTESTCTENLKAASCSTRVCAPMPQTDVPLLTIPQTVLLSALLLLAFVELTNWMSHCTCSM